MDGFSIENRREENTSAQIYSVADPGFFSEGGGTREGQTNGQRVIRLSCMRPRYEVCQIRSGKEAKIYRS